MNDVDKPSREPQILRPRARLLRTLGDELISNETVAVIELVKNAYDADATRVLVRFQGPLEPEKGRIEVIDNGHGMSLETIKTAWLEPATLMKKNRPRSEQRHRRVLGEKGIGRFAASRLANFLEVVTRRHVMEQEVRVFFDWSQFDDEEKYLDQVEVLWEEVQPSEICPDGTLEILWDEAIWGKAGASEQDEISHGTILRMEQLRNSWETKHFEELSTKLARLIAPSFEHESLKNLDSFQICLDFPAPFSHLSGIVGPPQAWQNPHYVIKGDIDEQGNYNLTLKLKGQETEERKTGQFILDANRPPQCGPLYIELRVWDRESGDLTPLAKELKSTLSEVRRDLNDVAGINIYRDGFRVLPYGEPRNDWLRLDLRRVQNPTLRLSNNQIIGYILISADANPNLRDQSNREGIMDGPAMDDLNAFTKMVLALLEAPRYALRRPEASPVQRGGLFSNLNLSALSNRIRQQYPQDRELLDAVEATEAELEHKVAEIQRVLARFMRLSTLGQLVDAVLHDGRAPLAKIKNEAFLGLRDIDRQDTRSGGDLSKQRQRLDVIYNQSDVLSTIFRRIEPFGGRKRGRPEQIVLEQVIADAFAVLQGEIDEVGVTVTLPSTQHSVTVDNAEIQEVVINLLQNSLYWLRKVPAIQRKISVDVQRNPDNSLEIIFADSGPGIEPEVREHIFDPYFSTRPDGVGLGLAIAGQIVADYYGGALELIETSGLPGATFRIILRRRI